MVVVVAERSNNTHWRPPRHKSPPARALGLLQVVVAVAASAAPPWVAPGCVGPPLPIALGITRGFSGIFHSSERRHGTTVH